MIALQSWKPALLRKGRDVAGQLEALLSGKEIDLAALPAPVAGEDDEQRLRRFLSQIDRAIKSFGTDAYGRCAQCGRDLAAAALGEQPWLADCGSHS